MIQIQYDNGGFMFISKWEGHKSLVFRCQNRDELIEALKHHLGKTGHGGKRVKCPLCRDMKAERDRYARQMAG